MVLMLVLSVRLSGWFLIGGGVCALLFWSSCVTARDIFNRAPQSHQSVHDFAREETTDDFGRNPISWAWIAGIGVFLFLGWENPWWLIGSVIMLLLFLIVFSAFVEKRVDAIMVEERYAYLKRQLQVPPYR